MDLFKNKFLYWIQLVKVSLSYISNRDFNERNLIKNIENSSICVFDIGSNMGSYIHLISSSNLNKKIKFYSFEPNLSILEAQNHIKLPSHHQLNLINAGVSNINGTRQFYKRSISSQSSFLKNSRLNEFNNIKHTELVKTFRLDDYLEDNQIKYIDLLKIDTEGLEYEVLQSMENILINKKVGLIKIEIDPNENRVLNLLHKNNYKLIGMTNTTYIENKLFLFDGYFKNQTAT
jgi:FkbM family methyltransferase